MRSYFYTFPLLLLALGTPDSKAFTASRSCIHLRTIKKQQATPQVQNEEPPTLVLVDEDAPAGVTGAEFFGGNTRKLEFYDPVAENNLETIPTIPFERFANNTIGRRLQDALNAMDDSIYASDSNSFQWDTVAQWKDQQRQVGGLVNPIAALKVASEFYRDLNVAVVSADTVLDSDTTAADAATTTTNTTATTSFRVRWELCVAWPIFWEPPAVVTGESLCTFKDDKIIRQVDSLDETSNGDLIGSVLRQILPRFWDVYHIGMTPVSEDRLAALSSGSILKPYQILRIPPRWVRRITQRDTSDRSNNAAAYLPNEVFTSFLKTVGPMKESYRTVRGVSIELAALEDEQGVDITWKIPLTVAYGAKPVWDLVADPSTDDSYELQPPKKYAVIGYGGWGPQDASVSAVRQKLFKAAIADGHKPAVAASGRPKFGFFERTIKACYKETGGLSMVVYEWRPRWTSPYMIYLELENAAH